MMYGFMPHGMSQLPKYYDAYLTISVKATDEIEKDKINNSNNK